MPKSTTHNASPPRVKLKLNEKPALFASSISRVEVLDDLAAPSMFAVTIDAWNTEKGELQWIDDSSITPGSPAQLAFGYDLNLSILLLGEVMGLEPEFTPDRAPVLTLRGYDLRHRLLRGCKTRSFTETTDGKIAETIAQSAGLSFLDETARSHSEAQPYVLQHNQTDFDFLRQRAQRIGCELVMQGKTLTFRPVPASGNTSTASPLNLDREADHVTFFPRLSLMDRPTGTEVRGWNPEKKAVLLAKVPAGSGPPRDSQKAIGVATQVTTDRALLNKNDADRLAQALYHQQTSTYITGDGRCRGNPAIRAGTELNLQGFGQRFNGPYYVVSATHIYDRRHGYITEFDVRRQTP